MSLRAALIAQLARFDDAAFAALANPGLLRRAYKDLEKQAAVVLEETAQELTVGVAGQRIRFDARGPAQAQCSCPASGVCQHILAAAIGLQRLSDTAPAPEVDEAAAAAVPAAATDGMAELHTALLAMDSGLLQKHAGRPGYRWAWQFVQDLDAERGLKLGGERHILIGFASPRLSFRYMGGPLESLVPDAAISPIEKYRVAAVLAYQRAHGVEIAAPETTKKPQNAALDFGKEHAGSGEGDTTPAMQARLRASVRQLLHDCVVLGLSHLSPQVQERFTTLSVWAQGAEHYRLALLLRRLADHVELLLQRAGGADEHRLLDELASASGLITALDAAAARGLAPTALLGRARSRYEEGGTLELIGLGAQSWRSASGYLGLTMLFWCPAENSFFSCTDARPEAQRGFDPIARYKAPGPWSGLGAPAQARGRRLMLTGAQINAAGRLSAAAGTSATLLESLSGEALLAALEPQASWGALRATRAALRQSLLAEPQPMKDWVVLRPAEAGKARFDAARQTLIWPLHDAAGDTLVAELAYSAHSAQAIGRIEQLSADGFPAGALLLVRLRGTASGLVAEPMSLIRGSGPEPVDVLHFDAAPTKGLVSQWLSKLKAGGQGAPSQPPAVASAGLPTALREMRHLLQRQSERGIADLSDAQAMENLRLQAEKAAVAGLTAFRPVCGGNLPAAARLLAAHYLVLQYERLIADSDDD